MAFVSTRRVVIVAFPDVQPLDVVGPAEVFHTAARLRAATPTPSRSPRPTPGPLRASAVSLVPDTDARRGARPDRHARGGRRHRACWRSSTTSAFLAALRDAAGPLAAGGRRVHRRVPAGRGRACSTGAAPPRTGRAARCWPSAIRTWQVDPDPIFVRDGHVYTSAGVTAGMDLALALVEEDLGRETALTTARWLVLFVKRPGGQAQFSAQLTAQHGRSPAAPRAAGLDRRQPGRRPLRARAGRARRT